MVIIWIVVCEYVQVVQFLVRLGIQVSCKWLVKFGLCVCVCVCVCALCVYNVGISQIFYNMTGMWYAL